VGPGRGRREVGSSSLLAAAIGEERELAHHEGRAADVEEAAVEPAVLVLEDAQPRNLLRDPDRGLLPVPARDADEHTQPVAERGAPVSGRVPRAHARAM
jgi:hypothetical protein